MRDHRIGEDEVHKFWPMGQLEYDDYIQYLDEESDARKMVDHMIEEGPSDEEKEMMEKMFNENDKDGSGRLDHHEWMMAARQGDEMMKKMLGEDAPNWYPGDQEFFWTMANSVKNGHWN